MGTDTKIEWAHHTFNPWIGCSKVSAGCANCYAEEMMDHRYGKAKWGPGGTRVRTSEANWKLPLKWNREAQAKGIRYRVFCASLADVFEDRPELVNWRYDLFQLIQLTPHLDWLLLTKRPEHIERLVEGIGDFKVCTQWPLPNVWIGTSVENQEQADIRIPKLLEIPAKVRFMSMEPLLGPVDLTSIAVPEAQDQLRRAWDTESSKFNCLTCHDDDRFHQAPTPIDWVIVGGESGPKARPMHPDWARSLRNQCQAAGVPFLFKQWGEWTPNDVVTPGGNLGKDVDNGKVQHLLNGREFDGHFRRGDSLVRRVGKHAAGRILDGRTWDELPEVGNAANLLTINYELKDD